MGHATACGVARWAFRRLQRAVWARRLQQLSTARLARRAGRLQEYEWR